MARESMDWCEREATWGQVGRSMLLTTRRGLRRPLWTVLLALAATAAAVFLLTRPGETRANVYLRITEAQLSDDSGSGSLKKGDLLGWIDGAVLSSGKLVAIADEMSLYRAERERGEAAVIESFTKDIELKVSDNYFLVHRGLAGGRRSARIRIGYAGINADNAVMVARRLAREVVEYERTTRIRSAERTLARIEHLASELESRLQEREKRLASEIAAGIEAAGNSSDTDRALHEVQLAQLARRQESANEVLETVRDKQNRLRIRLRQRAADTSSRLRVVHEDRPPRPLEPLETGLIAGFVFALVVPLAALATGAFDGRVRRASDLAWLDAGPIHTIPSSARTTS